MAVILQKTIADDVELLVYKIEEDLDFYKAGIDFTKFDRGEFQRISNTQKQLQWLASRYWVKKLSKQQKTLFLNKSNLGKPHITNHPLQFSISHSKDYIAVIISNTKEVAVDIEYIQDKIYAIKNKFLHPQDFEQGSNIENLSLIWSAKESIYKFYHDIRLYSFKEQIIVSKKNTDFLEVQVPTILNENKIKLPYFILEDKVLTCMA